MRRVLRYLLLGFGLVSCSKRAPVHSAWVMAGVNPVQAGVMSEQNNCYSFLDPTPSLQQMTMTDFSTNGASLFHQSNDFHVNATPGIKFGENLNFSFFDLGFAAVHSAFYLARLHDTLGPYLTPYSPAQTPWNIELQFYPSDSYNANYDSMARAITISHVPQANGESKLCPQSWFNSSYAWDADVILHEWGHALEDKLGFLSPLQRAESTSLNFENDSFSSVSEGGADFIAYTYSKKFLVGEFASLLMNRGPSEMRALPLNHQESFMRKVFRRSHDDATFVSGFLVALAQELSLDVTLKLYLETLPMRGAYDSFYNFGNELLSAERRLYGGKFAPTIQRQLQIYGLVSSETTDLSTLEVTLEPLSSQVSQPPSQGWSFDVPLTGEEGPMFSQPNCPSFQISIRNQGSVSVSGVEVFLPEAPPGWRFIRGNRRSLMGSLDPGSTSRLNRWEIDPWIQVCAVGSTSLQDMSIILRMANEPTQRVLRVGF